MSQLDGMLADKQGIANESLSPYGRTLLLVLAKQDRDVLLRDFELANADSNLLQGDSIPANWRGLTRQQGADILIYLHDPKGALALLELAPAPKSAREATRYIYLRSRLAAEGADWAEAISEIDRSNAANHGETVKSIRLRDPAFIPDLYARAGRNAEADEMIAAIPSDNYDGWRARGRIAGLRQNYASAEQALGEAVRQAPSFAAAYNDWGDLPGAIAKYGDANQRSPHWADPLKAWGDVLAKQGNAKEALVKYDDALTHAPNWAALKEARDAAAKLRGGDPKRG
jgi:tetratricopeptide (TPR) repeat protein